MTVDVSDFSVLQWDGDQLARKRVKPQYALTVCLVIIVGRRGRWSADRQSNQAGQKEQFWHVHHGIPIGCGSITP